VRRSAVLSVGSYRADLPAHEDDDVGQRLRAAGWELWCDHDMIAECIADNTTLQVLARYARWYEPRGRGWTWRDCPQNLRTSLRVMIPKDLAEHDWLAAFISLFVPIYVLTCAPRHPWLQENHRPPAPSPAA
jgi:hypothetical protein